MSALGDTEKCAICLDDYANDCDAETVLLPNCRHKFHTFCITRALQYNPCCVVCRKPVHCITSLPVAPLTWAEVSVMFFEKLWLDLIILFAFAS